MELCALTDSPSSIPREPQKCANCGSASRLENALCLNCLLHGALEDGAVAPAKTTFKETLAALDPKIAEWRIGDYEILDEIGRGGMGVIYRAREPHSGRIVALKCVLGYHVDSDQTLARFRREAETAARLDHPNIMPVYYVGEDDEGLPFFTMKFASGGSLAQARGTLRQDPRQSALLTAKIALAVEYAHNQGVLHRDLKPGNILLDHRREPLVSDFGLAKWQDTSTNLTRSLAIFGTPGYIAPEQAEGPAAQTTSAADVYSLGAILFELLTGRAPFLGEHALAVIRQAAEKTAPRLRSLAPHLDRDLETICARCLEREPSARYQSCRDLGQDLQNWLEDRAIRARPVGIAVQGGRWLNRNRVLGGTIAACCALTVASLLWQAHGRRLESGIREGMLATRSVLVMPPLDLDNLTFDPILAESVAVSLQHELDRLGPARVKTTNLKPSGALADLDQVRKLVQAAKTRTVLMGTQRTVHGKRRIVFRLLDGATGESLLVHVLAQSSQIDQANHFEEGFAQSLYTILSTKDYSALNNSKVDSGLRNSVARNAMTAGRELMSRSTNSDLDRAIALFKEAIQAQPDSPLAHSYLAIAATGRTHFIADRTFLKLGKDESLKAIQLSPNSADAHRALAGVYYQEGKFPNALEEELQTLEVNGPEERLVRFVAFTLDMLGRCDKALRWYSFESKLQGIPGEVDGAIGDCWAKLCDDQQALRAYTRATKLRPDCSHGQVGACYVRLVEGDFQGARNLCRDSGWIHRDLGDSERLAAQIEFFSRDFIVAEKLYRNLAIADPGGGGSFYGAVSYQSALGRIRQALGDKMGGRVILDRCLMDKKAVMEREPDNPEAAYCLAAVEASLALPNQSLEHLRAAVSLGWVDYRSLEMDPRFDSVRQHPLFQEMIKNLSAKVADMRVRSLGTNMEE